MRNDISRKGLVLGILLLFVTTSIVSALNAIPSFNSISIKSSNWLYVGGLGPGNYTKIQDAIDNATSGDTIFVFSGIYYENLLIDKRGISLVGEDRNTTIIDGGMRDDVVVILANFTRIQGFTIQNSSINLFTDRGIKAFSLSRNIKEIQISHCIFQKNGRGIYFFNVSDSSITDCQIENLTSTSILILRSSDNISIDHCLIKDCGTDMGDVAFSGGISFNGLSEFNCTNSTISDNNISNVAADGISLGKTINVNIFNNNIHHCTWVGISLVLSQNIDIHENTIFKNLKNGIMTSYCDVKISSNRIFDNGNGDYFDSGILIQDSRRNASIYDNRIEANIPYGLYLIRSPGSTIANNTFFQNKQSAYILSTLSSHWYGNYWDDWIGIGPKIIQGRLGKIWFPWVNFDWHPAQEPYNIPDIS